MIMKIFNLLTSALYSTPVFAILASFVWGILSILLSPCHLSSIPLIVGFIGGQAKITIRRAFILSFLFAFGILITIGLVGLITGLTGRMLGDIGAFGNIFVALIFFIIGLHLLDIIPLPFIGKIGQPKFEKKD